MHKRALTLVLVLVAACEKVTAPEARNVASKAERDLANGDLKGFFSIAERMSNPNLLTGYRPAWNNSLAIGRDGRTEITNAYVVENVFIPPGGFGKPIVRRTLAAWPETRDFVVAVVAERHPSEMLTDTVSGNSGYLPQPDPRAFVRVHFANPDQRWVPESGTVHIGDPVIDQRCDTKSNYQVVEGWPESIVPLDNVTCEFALFEVRMEGQFTRVSDMRNPLGRAVARRHHLTIASQRVPGIRFVTSCAEPPVEFWLTPHFTVQPCYPGFNGWIRYWRSNDLFAKSLGVDVNAMSNANGPNGLATFYARVIQTDTTKLRAPYVRWTLHRPDGTHFLSGSYPLEYPGDRAHFPIPEDWNRDLVMRLRRDVCGTLACGRVQAIVPEYPFNPKASRYSMLVLHAEPSAAP